MKGYGWRAYDPHKGGVQTIHDSVNQVDISTEFTKVADGDEGGNWGVRIRGSPRPNAVNSLKTTIVLNFAMEGMQPESETGLECATLYSKGKIECRGESPELGGFEIHIQDPKQGFSKMSVGTSVIPEDRLWAAKCEWFPAFMACDYRVDMFFAAVFMERIQNDSTRTDIPLSSKILALANNPGEGNMHFVQLVFEGSFSFDVLYSSDAAKHPMSGKKPFNKESTQF
jgi:mannosyl-oligosaccharide glucosidase